MNGLILAAAAPAASGGNWLSMVWMLGFFAIFYFLLIMPQRKQQKQQKEMLSNLKKGDKVITVGGIHGEIIDIDEEEVKLRIADKVEVKFNRGAVNRVKK